MPTYIYSEEVDCGEVLELTMSSSEMMKRERGGKIRHAGKTWYRRIDMEHGGFLGQPGAWPMKSQALGTTPADIGRMTTVMQAHGVPTDFAPDGRAILRDRDHRRRVMRVFGCHDRDGGYSD